MKVNNIKLNFLDSYYMFYDWLKDDVIENKKCIKIYKVSSKIIEDLMDFQIQLLDLAYIKDELEVLFTDEFSYIAVEFDKDGKSIFKSSLTLEDEVKIEQKIQTLKSVPIAYKKLKKDTKNNDLRINELIRKTIQVELNNLQTQLNTDKIAYLYYEWFKKTSDNNTQMLSNMLKKIEMPLTTEELKIYHLIKNNYKLV